MLRIIYNKKAQNFLEYAMLILILSAALMAMNKYVYRSIQARLKQVQTDLNAAKR